MAIIIVSSYLPFPLTNGGNIRLYNILKFLSKKNDITLICEKRSFQTDKDVEEVKKYCKKVITIPRKKQWTLSNITKSFLSFSSFLIVGHTLLEMKKRIREELERNTFDLIHVETSYVFQNLPKTNIPVVLVEHNIEFSVYKKYADKVLFLVRPFFQWDVYKLKNREISFWKKASKVVSVSEEEKEIIEKLSGKNNLSVVSNGVDLKKFLYIDKSKEKKEKVLFIGDFKWLENRDSLKFILEKIWPKISPDLNLSLWIIGRDIPRNLKNVKTKNVIFDENSKLTTQQIYKESSILLAPISVGGGTSFKILEAMASGVPVVTTRLGAKGIGAKDRENILIAESGEEIAKKLEELVINSSLFRRISINARKLIEEKYDWEKIGEKLEKIYKEVING